MKIRADFVSNSSSSSCIIIAKISNTLVDETSAIEKKFSYYNESYNPFFVPCENYKHEFGWEFENTSDFGGKLNFCAIQLLELFLLKINDKSQYRTNPKFKGEDFDRLYDMLKKVCKERFGFYLKLRDDLINMSIGHGDENGYYAFPTLNDDYYIDHQSCVVDDECMEMFESEDTLYDFLRFNESYIKGGNDNV